MLCNFCANHKVLLHRAYQFIGSDGEGYSYEDRESLLNDLTVAMCDNTDPMNYDPVRGCTDIKMVEELTARIKELESLLSKAKRQIVMDRAWRGR